MADDVDQRVFNGPHISPGIISGSAPVNALDVDAGDGVVHFPENILGKVHLAIKVRDI